MADDQFIGHMLSIIPEQEQATIGSSPQATGETDDTEGDEEEGETISVADIDANASRSVADIVSEYGFEEPQTEDERSVAEAVASALSAGTYDQRFAEFIGKLGLKHFRASELLYMGGRNSPGGACAGRNKLPSDAYWPVIVPTILLLDKIRTKLGSGVRITSAYRAKPYNTCVGGKNRSFHMEFNALDFQGVSASVSNLFDAVTEVVGTKTHFKQRYNTFVHLDTRKRMPRS